MKPNCYDCKHRVSLSGDAHSCCNHPCLKAGDGAITWIALQSFYLNHKFNLMNVTADPHGIAKGWFIWPINFDPVWLKTCDGFEKKGGEEHETNDGTRTESCS